MFALPVAHPNCNHTQCEGLLLIIIYLIRKLSVVGNRHGDQF